VEFWNPSTLPYEIAWEAWATFFAGLLAVLAAIIIGSKQAAITARQVDIAGRQNEILERQTAIAEQQVDIEATRLRADLYEDRLAIYTAMNTFIVDVTAAAGDVSNDQREAYFKAINASRFLMDDEVRELGRKIYASSIMLRSAANRLDRADDSDQDKIDTLVERTEHLYDVLAIQGMQLEKMMMQYLELWQVRTKPVDQSKASPSPPDPRG